MPASKAVFMGTVLTNGTAFVALFFRSEKNDLNNEIVDKFYWVASNSAGKETNGRNNALNGHFTSQGSAEANPPEGYGGVTVDDSFVSQYSLGWFEAFPLDEAGGLMGYANTAERTKASHAAAAAAGCDKIMFGIQWDDIFPTYSQQEANHISSWARMDDIISHAKGLTTTKGKPMNVCLRFIVSKDDGPHNDIESTNTSGFYGLSKSATDQLGKVIRVGYGIGHVSLAYTPGLEQLYDFVTKALLHYKGLLGSQFYWYSVVTSSQQENGQNYENEAPDSFPRIFDYSSYSQEAFRAWLASPAKYNNNPAALNAVWGTTYGNFSEVVCPGLGVSGGDEALAAIFKDNKGKDWYEWNCKMYDDFLYNVEQIGIVNNVGARFATESGSDTDVLSPRRQTIDILRWTRFGSMHKTQLGGFRNNDSFSHSIDILRTNYVRQGKKLGTEINDNDFFDQYKISDPAQMQNAMFEMAQYCILDAEAREITMISRLPSTYHATTLAAATRIRALMDNPVSRVPSTMPEFNYTKNQILDNGIAWLRNMMINAGHGLNSRIKATQVDGTIITPPTGCNFPISIYPIHQYCLSTLSFVYNNYDNDTSLQESLKNTHFRLILPTHSISYISGQLTLVTYKITGADSIVYIKNTQSQGFYTDNATDLGNPYRNNHPPVGIVGGTYGAANFFLPINQSYTLEVTNLTPSFAISSVVEYLNVDGLSTSPMVHRKKLTTGVDTFTFNPADIGTTYMRQFKLNCNRLSDTDSSPDI